MANLIDNAVAGIFKQTRRVSGIPITYTRGATSLSLTAIPGQTVLEVESGDIMIQHKSRDYLILAEELVFGGVAVVPARGDVITDNGKTKSVLAVGGEANWKYTDQSRQVIRVHTKEL